MSKWTVRRERAKPASPPGFPGGVHRAIRTAPRFPGVWESQLTLEGALQHLAALPLDTIPAPAPLPPGSPMPLSHNPLFVGRTADLQALAATLKGQAIAAIGPMAAATGLGGIGKTQLASEFVHRYGQFFAGGVCWLSFINPAAVPAEVAACGGPGAFALHPDFGTLPFKDQVELVQAAWQSPLPRLLVFDNCEDEALLSQWRPPSGGCRVLVTSRRAQWDAALGVYGQPLGVLSRVESIALLRQHRPNLHADDPALQAIAAELGDLPLALHLAGCFLVRYQHEVTPAAYLTQLQQPDLLLHPSLQGRQLSRTLSPTRHEQHVARTFALSYERLDATNALDARALALLARAAYFAPGEAIPRALLLATLPLNVELEQAKLDAADALHRLFEFGLLEPAAAGAVRLHRLLAAFVQAATRDVGAQAVVEQTMLADANRLNATGYPGLLQASQHHLRAVTHAAMPREDNMAARLCHALGLHLKMTGDYVGARHYYEQACVITEHALGSANPMVALSMTDVGDIYYDEGKYQEAELWYQRALTIYEQTLGLDNPFAAKLLNGLAALAQTLGQYSEAERLHKQVLVIRQRTLGPEAPETAISLNNLASFYHLQRKYAEAEPLYRQALAIMTHTYGPEHPEITTCLNNLAALYGGHGDHAKAAALSQQARTIVQQSLGGQHRALAPTLSNLAGIAKAQGRYAEAQSLYQQELDLLQHTLEPVHPDIARVLHDLATLSTTQGDYARAEAWYRQALAIRQQAFGPEHPEVVISLTHLGALFRAQQQYPEAEERYRQALAIREQQLDSAHLDTAASLYNLGLVLQAQGERTGARPYYTRAAAIYEARLDPNHQFTQAVRANLAALAGDARPAAPPRQEAALAEPSDGE